MICKLLKCHKQFAFHPQKVSAINYFMICLQQQLLNTVDQKIIKNELGDLWAKDILSIAESLHIVRAGSLYAMLCLSAYVELEKLTAIHLAMSRETGLPPNPNWLYSMSGHSKFSAVLLHFMNGGASVLLHAKRRCGWKCLCWGSSERELCQKPFLLSTSSQKAFPLNSVM